jgi:hypothetical protein
MQLWMFAQCVAAATAAAALAYAVVAAIARDLAPRTPQDRDRQHPWR